VSGVLVAGAEVGAAAARLDGRFDGWVRGTADPDG
jgi:hypothetical protein